MTGAQINPACTSLSKPFVVSYERIDISFTKILTVVNACANATIRLAYLGSHVIGESLYARGIAGRFQLSKRYGYLGIIIAYPHIIGRSEARKRSITVIVGPELSVLRSSSTRSKKSLRCAGTLDLCRRLCWMQSPCVKVLTKCWPNHLCYSVGVAQVRSECQSRRRRNNSVEDRG